MKSYNRRSFLRNAALVTAGTIILPKCSSGTLGTSPNNKLNIAMIGCGNIAGMAFDGCESENIVALCDVDSNMLFSYEEKYPQIRKAKTFSDFRVMLDEMGDEIDAVCVNTPDHTHFAATLASMERGKHVFTQKPLTHNIWQARTPRKAMHKYNVITNMGNQGHTYAGIRRLRRGQMSRGHVHRCVRRLLPAESTRPKPRRRRSRGGRVPTRRSARPATSRTFRAQRG